MSTSLCHAERTSPAVELKRNDAAPLQRAGITLTEAPPMLTLWSDLRLRNKLLIAMLAAGLLPLAITTYMVTKRSGEALQQAAFQQLESVREVKKSQVERHFAQLHQQVRELAESTMTIDAFQQLRDGFVALPEDLPSDPAHLKDYRDKVDGYYREGFGQHYQETTGKGVDTAPLMPQTASALIAQYLYIAANPKPLGTKDELLVSEDGTRYSRAHKRYHPRLRSFLKRFGYYDIFLVDAKSGDVVYTTFKELDFATNLNSGPYKDTSLSGRPRWHQRRRQQTGRFCALSALLRCCRIVHRRADLRR
jgi:methyl-accepting chemotaxis protein